MARYQEPEYAPWDGRRVPLTFVGGYLGAGKTTVINEVLAQTDRPIAVLVNDVGAVNVDSALLAKSNGDTIELTNGCVCCSLIDGFGAAFDQLRARPTPPDHVIVELSGLADPQRMVPWGRSAGFRLDGIVVLVDAETYGAEETSTVVAEAVDRQIRAADLTVLTKLDLVDDARAEQLTAELVRLAPEVRHLSGLDPATIATMFRLGGRRPGGETAMPPQSLFDAHRVESMAFPDHLDGQSLESLVESLPAEVVRAKGIARVDDTLLLVQVVGSRRTITELPQAERQEPTDLVVISLGPESI